MHFPQAHVVLALMGPCVALGLSTPADATCNSSGTSIVEASSGQLLQKLKQASADELTLLQTSAKVKQRVAADASGLDEEQLEEMGESPCNKVVSAAMSSRMTKHGTDWKDHPTCMKCTGTHAGAKPFKDALGKKITYTGCQWKGVKGSNTGKMCRMKVKDADQTGHWLHVGYTQTPDDCKTDWERAGGGQVHFSWWCAGNSNLIPAATTNPTKIARLVDSAEKVHYWYDPELWHELKVAIDDIHGITPHKLDRDGVHALVHDTPLAEKKEQIWKTLLAYREMGGNGCAAGKNLLSWLILNKHGGMHLDTSIQVPDAQHEAFKEGLLEPADFSLFPQKGAHAHEDKVFLTDDSALATIAGGQQWKWTPPVTPKADPVDSPAVDVWAIKSPSNDRVLQEIVKALLARGEKLGLLEETGGHPDPGKSTAVPMCAIKNQDVIKDDIACEGLKVMKDVYACNEKRTYKHGTDGTTSEETIDEKQVTIHHSSQIPQGRTYKLEGTTPSQTVQSSFVKTLSMAAVGVGLLQGNKVGSEDKLSNAKKFNTITMQGGTNPRIEEWGLAKIFAQTHAQHNRRGL